MNSPSLPELLAALRSDAADRRAAAAEALARIEILPPEAVLSLVDATADTSEPVAEWAAAALEELKPDDARLCPPLTTRLAEAGPVGYWSATLLGRLAPQDHHRDVVDALLGIVEADDADVSVQSQAVWALGKLGRPPGDDTRWEDVLRRAASSSNARLAKLAQQAIH